MTLATLIPAFRGSLVFIVSGPLLGFIWSVIVVTPNPFMDVHAVWANEIDGITARIIHALLDPKGTRWISQGEAVFLFFMSLGMAGGLVGAVGYHLPGIHAGMCPLVAPLSGETCPGA